MLRPRVFSSHVDADPQFRWPDRLGKYRAHTCNQHRVCSGRVPRLIRSLRIRKGSASAEPFFLQRSLSLVSVALDAAAPVGEGRFGNALDSANESRLRGRKCLRPCPCSCSRPVGLAQRLAFGSNFESPGRPKAANDERPVLGMWKPLPAYETDRGRLEKRRAALHVRRMSVQNPATANLNCLRHRGLAGRLAIQPVSSTRPSRRANRPPRQSALVYTPMITLPHRLLALLDAAKGDVVGYAPLDGF